MGLLSKIKLNLATRLADRAYRTRFFRDRAQQEIALQLREVRALRGLRQADLARRCKMKQSAISRIEQATYSSWTFKTLLRVAASLDVRVRVVFEPMEKAVEEYQNREKNLLLSRGITIPEFYFEQLPAGTQGVSISGTTSFPIARLNTFRVIAAHGILDDVKAEAWTVDRSTLDNLFQLPVRLTNQEVIGHG